jgi:hypothetical protein
MRYVRARNPTPLAFRTRRSAPRAPLDGVAQRKRKRPMCRLLELAPLSSTEGLRGRARATSRKKSSVMCRPTLSAFLTLPVNPASLKSDDRQEDTTRRALGSDQTDLAKWQSNLEGLAWTSLIFFAVEFAGMFTGVSLFMPTANAYYIFSHFFGALFVGLFVCLNWEISSYHWLFTLFSFFPALCEACLAFAVTQLSVMQYK